MTAKQLQFIRKVAVAIIIGFAIFLLVYAISGEYRTLPQIIGPINQANSRYGQMIFHLDSFNLSSKIMNTRIGFAPGPELRQSLKSLDELNIQITTSEFEPSELIIPKYPNGLYAFGTIYIQIINPEVDENEAAFTFAGSESAFPFDSYEQQIDISIKAPEYASEIPVQFWVVKNFPGYKVIVKDILADSLTIKVSRPWLPEILVPGLIWLTLTILSVWVFIRTGRAQEDGDVMIFVGIAALMIAIPTVRIVLVPSDINAITLLDVMLLLPLLVLLISIAFPLTVGAISLIGHTTIKYKGR